jgi:hypothetical protein
MSEMGTNRPRSALADAADKLARLARTVREQQIVELQGIDALRVTNVYSLSPDEVWSKRYMSQGIGPTPDCAKPGGTCPLPFAQIAPTTVTGSESRDLPTEAAATAHAQIGLAIGKPYRRRSWIVRALRGTP